MVTLNKDVVHGIANETTCIFWKLILNQGAELENIKMYGCWVHTISIEAVDYIEVEWQDCDHFVGRFQLTPEVAAFTVKDLISEFGLSTRIHASIEMKYLPVLVNHATTGHKLQGKTVKESVIAEWSRLKNWAYVVLSRVKTLNGLFLVKPIPPDYNFSPADDYLDMMAYLRREILATPEQVSELKQSLN